VATAFLRLVWREPINVIDNDQEPPRLLCQRFREVCMQLLHALLLLDQSTEPFHGPTSYKSEIAPVLHRFTYRGWDVQISLHGAAEGPSVGGRARMFHPTGRRRSLEFDARVTTAAAALCEFSATSRHARADRTVSASCS
jgi:hypothetical protein